MDQLVITHVLIVLVALGVLLSVPGVVVTIYAANIKDTGSLEPTLVLGPILIILGGVLLITCLILLLIRSRVQAGIEEPIFNVEAYPDAYAPPTLEEMDQYGDALYNQENEATGLPGVMDITQPIPDDNDVPVHPTGPTGIINEGYERY